jgi:membrane protein DedA with SNARE-associated domain
VSADAVLALHDEPVGLLGVLFAGDGGPMSATLVVYAACRVGGEQLARRVDWTRGVVAPDAIRTRLAELEIPALLMSRLIPGGRVPVLLAASLVGYPWKRFAVTDITASLLWSAVYMAIGLLVGVCSRSSGRA